MHDVPDSWISRSHHVGRRTKRRTTPHHRERLQELAPCSGTWLPAVVGAVRLTSCYRGTAVVGSLRRICVVFAILGRLHFGPVPPYRLHHLTKCGGGGGKKARCVLAPRLGVAELVLVGNPSLLRRLLTWDWEKASIGRFSSTVCHCGDWL